MTCFFFSEAGVKLPVSALVEAWSIYLDNVCLMTVSTHFWLPSGTFWQISTHRWIFKWPFQSWQFYCFTRLQKLTASEKIGFIPLALCWMFSILLTWLLTRLVFNSLNDTIDHSKCSSLLNIKTQQDLKFENKALNYEIVTNLLKILVSVTSSSQGLLLQVVFMSFWVILNCISVCFRLFFMALFTCACINLSPDGFLAWGKAAGPWQEPHCEGTKLNKWKS